MGALVAAEFAVAVGDLSTFAGPNQLAAYAGLAPMPRDSGRRAGNLQRPQRYHRPPRRALFMAALTTIRFDGPRCSPRRPAWSIPHKRMWTGNSTRPHDFLTDSLWLLLGDADRRAQLPGLRLPSITGSGFRW